MDKFSIKVKQDTDKIAKEFEKDSKGKFTKVGEANITKLNLLFTKEEKERMRKLK